MSVSNAIFYPQTPQGGLFNPSVLISPPRLRVAATAEQGLGDLGVDIAMGRFEKVNASRFKIIDYIYFSLKINLQTLLLER